jgi:hypothetical protein
VLLLVVLAAVAADAREPQEAIERVRCRGAVDGIFVLMGGSKVNGVWMAFLGADSLVRMPTRWVLSLPALVLRGN